MIGIILAAGDGSRLKSSRQDDSCKPLIRINNMPLITFSLENLLNLNIDRVCIVIGKEGELIRQAIGNTYKGLSVHYVSQSSPKGLIHALMQALNALEIDESVILQLSDEIYIELKTEEILRRIHTGAYDFICGITPEENPEKIKGNYSVEMDADGNLRNCTEKPLVVTNQNKGTGFCYFTARALALLKMRYDETVNSPVDLCSYMNLLIQEQYTGLALQVAEKEFNINTAADLDDVQCGLRVI